MFLVFFPELTSGPLSTVICLPLLSHKISHRKTLRLTSHAKTLDISRQNGFFIVKNISRGGMLIQDKQGGEWVEILDLWSQVHW